MLTITSPQKGVNLLCWDDRSKETTAVKSPRIILASANPHKAEEIGAMLAQAGLRAQVVSLIDFPHLTLPEEDGATFEANALKKARAMAKQTGLIALADDSGLEVEALGGAPGVHSKRFAGEAATDEQLYEKLLGLLRDIPEAKRGARFKCCLAIVAPGRGETVVEGICPGKIAFAPRGQSGFGYDPVFVPEGWQQTLGEVSLAEKNRVSHRAQALQAALPVLQKLLKEIAN
jgi:XTP/dITP diphosphohydrolase